MERSELAARLRWLAGEYRAARPELKAAIQAAFLRGLNAGPNSNGRVEA